MAIGRRDDVEGCLMLPITNRVLRLREIAEYWSREIGGVRPSDEILDELLSAFWRNQLHVNGSTGNDKVDRLAILRIVNRRREHPGFTLIENTEEQPSRTETMPDGSVLVDLTNYVTLPADEPAWTKGLVEAAYERLATTSFDDFTDMIKPGLEAFGTTREALRNYCEAKGYDLPRF